MPLVRIETEINAPPEEVRAVILDFPRYKEWHKSFITAIASPSPSTPTQSLPPGTLLSVNIGSTKLTPIVRTNTATEFAWYGRIWHGAFAGRHSFQFLESKITDNGTTFVHAEEFDGWLTWVFDEGVSGVRRRRIVKDFEGFSGDVKKRVEALGKMRGKFKAAEDAALAKI